MSSEWSVIRVVCHQVGLSSGWSVIRMVCNQGGLSIRVVSHQGGLSYLFLPVQAVLISN